MKLFNKKEKEDKKITKASFLPVYFGFASILFSFAMLAVATYSWFTDTVIVTGNKANAGNIYIDLLADDEFLNDIDFEGDRENFRTYVRKVDDVEKEYYVITNSEVPVIELKNVEPGQVFPVRFYVVNRGSLAVKYSAGFEIQLDDNGNSLSLTGLQTLTKNHNNGLLEDDEYQKILSILKLKQTNLAGEDIGGHLEDILDVYLGTSEEDIIPENYIGKLKQVMNGEFDTFIGYSLPIKEVKDSDGNIIPKHVEIVDMEGNYVREENNVTELETLEYLIKMPEDATSLYEYASLSFSLGASASQVEYEKDGINNMLYDAGELTE